MSPPAIFVELVPSTPSDPNKDAPDGDGLLRLSIEPGQTLAQALYLSDRLRPPVLCSGLACCGRCRVRVLNGAQASSAISDAEKRFFSREMLEEGWRLGCRQKAVIGLHLELPPEAVMLEEPRTPPQAANGQAGGAACGNGDSPWHGLAIDLGTTSLHWKDLVVFCPDQEIAGEERLSPQPVHAKALVVKQGSEVNPQMGAGSDVIGRLAVAQRPGGSERLRGVTLAALRRIVSAADERARAENRCGVEALCLAANPAMTAITLGLDTRGLASAPYSLPLSGGGWEQVPGLPPLWIPPQLSPFVGGDISAGYAALALDPAAESPRYPFLLADMGTNGEFLLALSPDEAWAASVALGPALEGTGLSHGSEARPGAVSGFSLTPAGLEMRFVSGNASAANTGDSDDIPPGITGTGYLSLANLLLTAGVLGRDGRFVEKSAGPFGRYFSFGRDEGSGEPFLRLGGGMRMTATDVEELLKVKAAFSLGLRRLLDAAAVPTQKLVYVYLAGALGEYADKQALENLGFFPRGMASRLLAKGNTSLEGAELLLRSPQSRASLKRWASSVVSLELAADEEFVRSFPEHMRFAW